MEVYAQAQDGLAGLESDPEKRLKYADFIEAYADLSEDEWVCYCNEYLPKSERREVIMGLVQRSREEGRQLGRQEGRREGLLKGIALGLNLKFGAAGAALLPEISRIQDATVLEAILRSLETTDELDAVRRIYH